MQESQTIPAVSFWFFREKEGTMMERNLLKDQFAPKLIKIGSCDTIENFWKIYQHITKPSECRGCDFQVFKEGIEPMWEDPHNKEGGAFSFLIAREGSSVFWDELVIAFCGGVIPFYEEINGVSISTRKPLIQVQIWFKRCDQALIDTMKKEIGSFFMIPEETNIKIRIFKKKKVMKIQEFEYK